MIRFNSRVAAAVLIALAATYMVASIATGRTAHAEVPADLTVNAADAALTVPKSVAALLGASNGVMIDIRSADEFATYHIPGSVSAAGADAEEVKRLASGRPAILIASKDEVAQSAVVEAQKVDPKGEYHFLQNGVRDFYLTYELPVALFNDDPPPRGYAEAVGAVRSFVSTRDPRLRDQARHALLDLARYDYEPAMLRQAGKAKPAGGPRKKISGGCGG